MVIVMNGKEKEIPDGTTLATLLQDSQADQMEGVAVAINSAVVPRRRWSEVVLHDGDKVEVIHAVQGG